MEEKGTRADQHEPGESPGAPSRGKSRGSHDPRMLGENRQSLNCEEDRRPAVPAAGGNRDYRVVNDSAEGETGDQGPSRSDSGSERAEQEPVRQVTKGRVPAPAPEVTDAGRGDRPAHERLCRHSDRSPGAREQVKRAEVKDEDEPDHAHPADEVWAVGGYHRCDRI